MKTTNALVTYSELATMGLIQKVGTNPPGGSQCATKDFINTYYHADAASLAGYTGNRLPPYQVIIPDTVPFLLCYNLTITNTIVTDSCGNAQDAENWAISLVDQFGNAYITPVDLNFGIRYYRVWQSDVPPYSESGYVDTSITVYAGNYQGFGQYIHHYVEACPYSSMCDGSCYTTISEVNLTSTPGGITGGCALPPAPPLPPDPCGYKQLLFPEGFSPNGDGVNDVWRFFGTLGVPYAYTEITYSCFPNTTWDIYDITGTTMYAGTGTTYVPWNGKLNNTGADVPDAGYYYSLNLGDGSGTRKGFVIVQR